MSRSQRPLPVSINPNTRNNMTHHTSNSQWFRDKPAGVTANVADAAGSITAAMVAAAKIADEQEQLVQQGVDAQRAVAQDAERDTAG
jgi:hypothetical protein